MMMIMMKMMMMMMMMTVMMMMMMMVMLMMMMMMMMMCKILAQVPMLCVPTYNIKLAMMPTTPFLTTFSAHTKMAAGKRGQS